MTSALASLAADLELFRSALGRLWWHTEDDYLRAVVTQAVTTIGDYAPAFRGEAPSEPASPSIDSCFEVQENALALCGCVGRTGRQLLARYAEAAAAANDDLRLVLEEQRAELEDILALVESLGVWLERERRIVDARVDDLLQAERQRSPRHLGRQTLAVSSLFGL